jgi:regulatory protein
MEDSAPATRPDDERAIQLAYRAVGKRDRTIAELRSTLERKQLDPLAIDAAVAELEETGWLDDARYAQRFAEDKRALERWGSERIARDLRQRGVAAAHVEAAVALQGRADELATAVLLLEQRLPTPPGDDQARSRAWQLLVRRGYESELAYEAVRLYERRDADRHAA